MPTLHVSFFIETGRLLLSLITIIERARCSRRRTISRHPRASQASERPATSDLVDPMRPQHRTLVVLAGSRM